MVTVVILAKNEAANLRKLLPTLSFADEVLVLDDESTDSTAMVCQQYGVKRLVWPLHNDYAAARNFGLEQVKSGWVLFLDADERLPSETIKEILTVVDQKKIEGYYFRRIDVFYGKKLKWGETGSVRLIRLGRVGAGKWEGKVHEVWKIRDANEMKHEVLHFAHMSLKSLFKSVRRYARIRARELYEQQQYWNVGQQLIYPPFKFLYTYLIQLGFLDGWRGLVMSVAMAWHSWLVRWYLWDINWTRRSLFFQLWRLFIVLPIVLLPFGQLLRGFPFPIYVHEILMIVAMITTGMRYLSRKTRSAVSFNNPLVVFSIVLGCSYVVSLIRGFPVEGGLQLGRWYLYVGYLLSLLWGVKNDLKVSIVGLLMYWGGLIVAFGWLQYLLLPDMRFLSLLGWDDHYYRMVGTLFDPNYLGLLLVLVFVWGYFKDNTLGGRSLWVGALGGLVATFSRMSWLTLIIILGWYVVRYKWNWWIGFGVMLMVGVYMLLPKPGGEGVNLFRVYSLTNRFENWAQTEKIIYENLWTGIGFNQYATMKNDEGRYGAVYLPKSPDNSFLFVLVTAGLPGIASFIWLIWWWWQQSTDLALRLSLAAILIHGMANNSFFYPFILMWWWLLLAYRQQQINGNSEL